MCWELVEVAVGNVNIESQRSPATRILRCLNCSRLTACTWSSASLARAARRLNAGSARVTGKPKMIAVENRLALITSTRENAVLATTSAMSAQLARPLDEYSLSN